MVLPRPKRRAIAADLRLRAARRRHRRRPAAARARSASGSRRCAPTSPTPRPAPTRRSSRWPTREPATASRARRSAALVDGGLQDTEQARYADFDELRGYCEKVAGAVGLACLPVYGSSDTERACTLGIALQLINIVRDVREDWELGRVYLPQDELAAHGVSEDDIAGRRVTPAWRSLMAFQAARARAHLDEGLRLLDSLDRRSRALRRHLRRPLPRRPSSGSRRPATTSSVRRRGSRRPRSWPSSPGGYGGEGGRGRGRPRGPRRSPRPRRRRPRGDAARGAADARRGRADAARARGRPAAAAGQRPAHRARLLHRVPALPRADRRGRLGAPRGGSRCP